MSCFISMEWNGLSMFDVNVFKKQVKDWILRNPNKSEQELLDFCEEQIPSVSFAGHEWLLEQTVFWFRHMGLAKKNQVHWDEEE
jgi:hypothetical protein